MGDKSPYIIAAVEHALEDIQRKLQVKLPNELKIRLFTAGGQIVSGVNIYLEFRIGEGPGQSDVQVLAYEPALRGDEHDRKMEVRKLHVTSRRIFGVS